MRTNKRCPLYVDEVRWVFYFTLIYFLQFLCDDDMDDEDLYLPSPPLEDETAVEDLLKVDGAKISINTAKLDNVPKYMPVHTWRVGPTMG